MKPFILGKSNFDDGYPVETKFGDYLITCSEQSDAKQTLKLVFDSGADQGVSSETFITGSGNLFTIYSELNATISGNPYKAVNVFSGKMVSDGIEDLKLVYLITEPTINTLKRGQGRLFKDGDSLSEKQ